MATLYSRARRVAALIAGGASIAFAGATLVRRVRALDLRGKVAIVTGGSRGLGLLMAEELGRRGARVAICGRDAVALERAERWLTAHGIEVVAEARDLGDPKAAGAFVERVVREFGQIDVLINNAGIIQVAPFAQVDIPMIEQAMRCNFWSAVHMTFAAMPYLKKQKDKARIVNITSVGGRAPLPHLLAYTASKFAMVGLSEALHAELASAGIKVTTVVPGPMRTGSFYNAEFRGHQRGEFAWFSVLSSLPILSVDAERAARRVRQAMREGRAEIRLGLSGHLISLLHGMAPRLFVHFATALNRLLPPPSKSDELWKGREVNSTLPGTRLLALGDRAARHNNEEPPV
jgi:NAD(P)-dependent dehydrogenase (short-subunit alcohol dehydrogenase family)